MRALEAAADHPYWIGRPIEMPGSRPLDFESSPDVATELATWPRNHVVKCLAFYHPDDPDDLRERQERQLLRLQDAARQTSHELPGANIAAHPGPLAAHTVARALTRHHDPCPPPGRVTHAPPHTP